MVSVQADPAIIVFGLHSTARKQSEAQGTKKGRPENGAALVQPRSLAR